MRLFLNLIVGILMYGKNLNFFNQSKIDSFDYKLLILLSN